MHPDIKNKTFSANAASDDSGQSVIASGTSTAVKNATLPSFEVNKPKVLVYSAVLLPYSQTFILEQTRNLQKWQGILVGETGVENGLELTGMDVRFLDSEKTLTARLQRRLNRWLRRHSSSAVKLLKQEKARLLHVHFATNAASVWPIAKTLNLPMLVTLHGYDINRHREWWESGNAGRQMKSYPARLLKLAQEERVHFLAVSQAIKQRAIEYGLPAHKITVSYIGVDTERFRPGPTPISDRRQILFVGRLVEKKGCQYLLQAYAAIQDDFPETELVIVGGGPLERQLKEMADENHIRARFMGALSSEQVQNMMSEARIFCLPSITAENGDAEGMGIVILEAQASGVPVITSARGGAAEGIVDGETGYAHKEKDIGAIQDALTRLLTDDALANRFGQAARQNILDKMDIRTCTLKLEEIYSQNAC